MSWLLSAVKRSLLWQWFALSSVGLHLCFLYSGLGKWRCHLVLWVALCRGHVVWGNKPFLALLSQLPDLRGSGSFHVCPPWFSGLGLSLRAALVPSPLKCFFQATVCLWHCVWWSLSGITLLTPAPHLLCDSASPYWLVAPWNRCSALPPTFASSKSGLNCIRHPLCPLNTELFCSV